MLRILPDPGDCGGDQDFTRCAHVLPPHGSFVDGCALRRRPYHAPGQFAQSIPQLSSEAQSTAEIEG
ncbi:hypothetical protein ColTof3_03008 [Colletotrichum tofieldiae]|nr:hypothetical protein ColTof3_03008 [Colletotrichum tofieldiae]